MKKAVAAGGVVAVILWLASAPASAVDGIAIEGGSTHSGSTHLGRIALQWDWDKRWFQASERHLGGLWDVVLGHWNGDVKPGQNSHITEIGLTPVFRYQRNDLRGLYLEGGIGFHWLSRTQIGNRQLGTAFQFGDHVGVGCRFGAKGHYDLGYRFQHLSNGNIKRPNEGMDYHLVRLQYHY